MTRLKTITVLFLLCLFCLDTQSCRKKYAATAEDMAEYGWVLYEQKDFVNSNAWFTESIVEDSSWKDGYNGLGWTWGKLKEADTSLIYFNEGMDKTQFEWDTTDTHSEILAGLTFAHHALGHERLTIYYGDSLITRTDKPLQPHWTFSHDTLLNHLDVRITMAAAYYALGKFDSTIIQISKIFEDMKSNQLAVTDTTILGRKLMANQIDSLQAVLLEK